MPLSQQADPKHICILPDMSDNSKYHLLLFYDSSFYTMNDITRYIYHHRQSIIILFTSSFNYNSYSFSISLKIESFNKSLTAEYIAREPSKCLSHSDPGILFTYFLRNKLINSKSH